MLKHHGLNEIFLVGEVVDVGTSVSKKHLLVRCRLKVKTFNDFVYLDVYSHRLNNEAMYLICQTGNIVYAECRFDSVNSYKTKTSLPLIRVMRMTCLRRSADVEPPDTSIIHLLDKVDPISYLEEIKLAKNKKEDK